MTETELGPEDITRLHTLEHLLGVEPDASDKLESGRTGVAVDTELSLDGTGQVLLLDTEEDRGSSGGRSSLGRGLG